MSIETETEIVQVETPDIEVASKVLEESKTPKVEKAQAELTKTELDELKIHEDTIRSQSKSFVNVGRALRAIDEKRLYRAEFSTFEDYCPNKWGFTDKHAYRLIKAAKVLDALETKPSPIGEGPSPANEAQARPLTELEPNQWVPAWKKVLKTAGKKPITEELVRQVIDEMETSPKLKKKSKKVDPKAEAKARLQRVSGDLKELGTFLKDKQYAKIRKLVAPLVKEIEKHLLTLKPIKS